MEENIIDIYKILYFRNGNDENFFDYETHMKLYKNYLYLFYDVEINSPFYMNYDFLYYVVLGFAYFHDIYLDEYDNYDDMLLDISFEQYNSILLSQEDNNVTAENVIVSLSWLCISNMIEQKKLHNHLEMTKCLIDNNCRINKVLSKTNDRGM